MITSLFFCRLAFSNLVLSGALVILNAGKSGDLADDSNLANCAAALLTIRKSKIYKKLFFMLIDIDTTKNASDAALLPLRKIG